MHEDLRLYVNHLGETKYLFTSDCTTVLAENKCNLKKSNNYQVYHHKDNDNLINGILTKSNTTIPKYSRIYQDKATSVCIIGKYQKNYCHYCYQRIIKKAFVRSDSNIFTYCTKNCLEYATDYLDSCSTLINSIYEYIKLNQCTELEHFFILIINYLYGYTRSYLNSNTNDLSSYQRILLLESHCSSIHIDKNHNNFENAIKWITTKLNEEYNDLLKCINHDIDMIKKLFYIIKYNAQVLPLYETKDTYLLCLLPSISRINHSCQPTCTLYYSIEEQSHQSNDKIDIKHHHSSSLYHINVSVVSLKDIEINEEITMTYIQPLYASVHIRRDLLQQAYHFTCTCIRCTIDSNDIDAIENGFNDICYINGKKICYDCIKRLHDIDTMLLKTTSSMESNLCASWTFQYQLLQLSEEIIHNLLSIQQEIHTNDNTINNISSLESLSYRKKSHKLTIGVSNVYDAATFIIVHFLSNYNNNNNTTIESINNKNIKDIINKINYLSLVIRSGNLLSISWIIIDNNNILSRFEVIMNTCNLAIKLKQNLFIYQQYNNKRNHKDEIYFSTKDIFNSIEKCKKDLIECIQILNDILISSKIDPNRNNNNKSINVIANDRTYNYYQLLYDKCIIIHKSLAF